MENVELTEAGLTDLIKNLTTLNKTLSSFSPEKLYKAFKSKNRVNDLAVAQQMFLKLGVTEQQIQAISKAWKANYNVTPKEVRNSFGTGQSSISDLQMQGLFNTAYETLGVQPAGINAKRNNTFNKHLDKFDDDLEQIGQTAKQLGFKDGAKLKSMDWKEIKQNPAALKELAALGYSSLKFKPKKPGKNEYNFATEFDDVLASASKFGLKNPVAFIKDVKKEKWETVLHYPAALAGLAAIGNVLIRW